ncbi:hypothetical protein OG921_20175 [Aldersonia sp. NBC_00410]|nr:hypothetical protein [Aldersonia sp. NBC_00410]MCX5045490.1 hypothetical protein [Aldersonia sp. NBC_00410]
MVVHIGLASSPNAAALVLNALDPAHPRAVDCVPTQAVTGGPLR